MSSLSVEHLSKTFSTHTAVHDVSLEIRSGEFFSILGPSGCGKTTLLRMIAGFESPSSGSIRLNGQDITNTSPQFRKTGMVFQNYALFPHMTVYGNVAFGLETKNVPREERRGRVQKILASVGLEHKIDEPVPNLSGGEQQRVALARALVVEPAVLLFDEPLSNLDVALRLSTREEIRALQRKTGITSIYVTHDQTEAMSLSDRMAVMREGKIEQVGTPAELYEHPSSVFVARFLGGANVVRVIVSDRGSSIQMKGRERRYRLTTKRMHDGSYDTGIKPEALTLSASSQNESGARIIEKEFLGFTTMFLVQLGEIPLRVSMVSTEMTRQLQPGSPVDVDVDWHQCNFFPV